MSETTTTPAADDPQPAPPPPQATEAPPAASEQTDDKQPDPAVHGLEKRVNRLTARFSEISRERDALAARLAAYEQQQSGRAPQPVPPEMQEVVRAEAQKLFQMERAAERTREFHAAGSEAYPDWAQKCQSLIAMGADTQISQMLVEMKDGARIAAALSEAPEEVERIANIRSEHGRAVALGQFVAKLEDRAANARPVSKAPRPPTPPTGRTEPKFNEYTTNDTQALVKFYAQQAMEKRMQK